ncbi:hypothetical protein [Treponema pedis]|uniref:hypothetical protein n=1 Tax=Treponema pedis TaxID=409322 RepID=UPI000411E31B|nr:hypothetical protein [Treponema pedis]
MKKEEILSEVNKMVSPFFAQIGFSSNKKKDIYTKKENPFEFRFNINISSMNIQHLSLSVINKEIEYLFQKVKSMYINQSPKEKFKKGQYPICSLTDWKCLYNEKNLAIGNIWFKMFSNLEEIKKYKEEYLTAIKLATQWFDKCKNLCYVYQYNLEDCFTISLEMALCIRKFLGYDISRDYEDIIFKKSNSSGWDKKDFEIFYNYLKNV